MNKKFFGFLLVIAALFSVCTLESCKDTNADLTHEQMVQSSQQYQDLLNRINELKAMAHNCECQAVKSELTAALADEIAKVMAKLGEVEEELNGRIDGVEADLADLAQQVKDADEALQALIDEVSARVENLAQQARSINVKAVYTNFGTFNTPFGLNNGLAIAYVPSFDTVELCGEVVEAGETVSAGKIYLTINPVSVDFAGLPVELVTTAGNAAPGFELTALATSDEEIQFGIGTRANQYLYETEILANVEDVEKLSLDVEGIKDAAKRIIDNKRINFRELGNVALETLKNAKLDAYLVSLNQGDSVTLASDELLAAVAVEPLNFTHIDALGTLAEKAANKVQAKLEALETKIEGIIDINVPSGTVEVEVPSQTITIPTIVEDENGHPSKGDDDEITVGGDKVEVEIPTISGLDNLSKVSDLVSRLVDIASAGLDKAERLTVLANPVMFVLDEKGKFCALSTNPNKPTVVSSADITLYPSSYCLETVVPYYAKYVHVDGNDAEVLTEACGNVVATLGNGVVKIEYAALDYAGNQSQPRYYYVKVAE